MSRMYVKVLGYLLLIKRTISIAYTRSVKKKVKISKQTIKVLIFHIACMHMLKTRKSKLIQNHDQQKIIHDQHVMDSIHRWTSLCGLEASE